VRRLFWLAMGITIGALVVRKMSKLAAKMTPGGMAQSVSTGLSDLADAIRDFADDVRDAMSDRESQLRVAAGLDDDGTGSGVGAGASS